VVVDWERKRCEVEGVRWRRKWLRHGKCAPGLVRLSLRVYHGMFRLSSSCLFHRDVPGIVSVDQESTRTNCANRRQQTRRLRVHAALTEARMSERRVMGLPAGQWANQWANQWTYQ